ncbi:MAG: hypothetical protein Q9180_007758 [Flavoplaca navasiana]
MATGTDDGARFVELKFLDFQRSSARRYICPYCEEDAFVQEPKLWEHAKNLHWDALQAVEPGSDEGQLRKQLRAQAVEKASDITSKSIPSGAHPGSTPLSKDYGLLTSDIGDDVGHGSPPMSVSTPGFEPNGSQCGSPQKIHDFGKLTLGQPPGSRGALDPPSDAFSMSNPLKRRPTENLETSQLDSKSHAIGHTASARRREKARSGGPIVVLDPDDRTGGERFVPNDRKLSRNSYSSTKRCHRSEESAKLE